MNPASHPDLAQRRQRLDGVLEWIRKHFPFPGYVGVMRPHRLLAETTFAHLPAGRILDFGAGACDKTAVLALSGYEVHACDDLSDAWHLEQDNRAKILAFAQQAGIKFTLLQSGLALPYHPGQFDMAVSIDVLEHLHDSPRDLLCNLLEWLKPGGLLLLAVPNAANLRKRLALLVGSTNYPPYAQYFWYPGAWRGHVREYVIEDLRALSRFLQVDTVLLRDVHMLMDRALPNRLARSAYLAFASLVPVRGLRDGLLLLARKPEGWNRQRVQAARRVPDECTWGAASR